MKEDSAIPLAISQAKKVEKSNIPLSEVEINTLNEFISKASSIKVEQMLQLLSEVEEDNINLEHCLTKSTDNTKTTQTTLTKAVNKEERLALFVALPVKDEALDEYDLHQDSYSAEEVRKAMLSYNEHCMKAGVYHLYETKDAIVTQSYLAPVDLSIESADGEIRVIKAGTWLQEWFFPETEKGDELWDKVKTGVLTGISIQCNCVVEDINE
jgi:hypothetical protein